MHRPVYVEQLRHVVRIGAIGARGSIFTTRLALYHSSAPLYISVSIVLPSIVDQVPRKTKKLCSSRKRFITVLKHVFPRKKSSLVVEASNIRQLLCIRELFWWNAFLPSDHLGVSWICRGTIGETSFPLIEKASSILAYSNRSRSFEKLKRILVVFFVTESSFLPTSLKIAFCLSYKRKK